MIGGRWKRRHSKPVPPAAGAGSNLQRLLERGDRAEAEESHTGLAHVLVGAMTGE